MKKSEVLNEKNIIEDIPLIVGNLNEPFGDSSFIPTFYVSRLAQKKVKVATSIECGFIKSANGNASERLERNCSRCCDMDHLAT